MALRPNAKQGKEAGQVCYGDTDAISAAWAGIGAREVDLQKCENGFSFRKNDNGRIDWMELDTGAGKWAGALLSKRPLTVLCNAVVIS